MLGLGIALGAPAIDRTGTLQVSKYVVTNISTGVNNESETEVIRYTIVKSIFVLDHKR